MRIASEYQDELFQVAIWLVEWGRNIFMLSRSNTLRQPRYGGSRRRTQIPWLATMGLLEFNYFCFYVFISSLNFVALCLCSAKIIPLLVFSAASSQSLLQPVSCVMVGWLQSINSWVFISSELLILLAISGVRCSFSMSSIFFRYGSLFCFKVSQCRRKCLVSSSSILHILHVAVCCPLEYLLLSAWSL